MKKLYFIFLLLLFSKSNIAQQFEWALKGSSSYTEMGESIFIDEEENIYLLGRIYDTIHIGGFTVTGPFPPPTFISTNFLAKLDSSGNVLNVFPLNMKVNSADYKDGYFYLAGWNTILKMDTAGNVIWQRWVNGEAYVGLYGICVGEDGTVYTLGKYSYDVQIENDHFGTFIHETGGGWLAAYDTNGELLWTGHIYNPGQGSPRPNAISADSTGVYVTGGGHFAIFEGGNNQIILASPGGSFIAKFSLNGEVLWAQRPKNGPGADGVNIIADNKGNYYIKFSIGYFAKYNNDGDFIWGNFAEGSYSSIFIDNLDNIYIAGSILPFPTFFDELTFNSSSLGGDAYVAKFDSMGKFKWIRYSITEKDIINPYYQLATGFGVIADNKANIYFTGVFEGVSAFDDIILASEPGEFRPHSRDLFIAKIKDEENELNLNGHFNTETVCKETVFYFPYQSDTCLPGNRFYAQLSDVMGDFSNSIFIGDTLTQISGTIKCLIPDSLSEGSGYKLRLVASNPHTIANEFQITIKDCTTSVSETSNKSSFVIYPNPAGSNGFSIEANFSGTKKIIIRNMTGAKVYETTTDNIKTNISNFEFPTGLYFVELQSDEIRMFQKIMVNK
jgi:hypothetical protein